MGNVCGREKGEDELWEIKSRHSCKKKRNAVPRSSDQNYTNKVDLKSAVDEYTTSVLRSSDGVPHTINMDYITKYDLKSAVEYPTSDALSTETYIDNNESNFRDKFDQNSISEKRGLTLENESTIKRNFIYLKDEIDVDCGLLDHFFQENIFTDDQVESINSAGSRRRKVDCFLRMLLHSKQSAYGQFLDILKQTKCDYIVKFLESNSSQAKLELCNCTALEGQRAIRLHRDVIIDQLEPDNITDYFIQYEEFTVDEYESVISQITRRDKALKLLEILSSKNHMPRGYFVLLKALEDTKEIYLYQLLNSKLKTESDPELHDSKQMTQILLQQEEQVHMKDENEIIIKTTIVTRVKKQTEAFGPKKDIEGKILETLKMENVIIELNDVLFANTKCLVTDVKKGSIVFRIKCCGNNTFEDILKKGQKEGIQKILKVIFSHPHVQKYLREENVLVTELGYIKTCHEDNMVGEKKQTSKDVISKNYSFMVEEIDSVMFHDLDIFTKEEKDKLCELREVSRAKASMQMFTLLLAKPEWDVDKFLEEIKLKKKFIWNHICSENVQHLPEDALMSSYDILVENISPSVIANHCIDNGLLPNYQAFASTVHQRKSRAKYMVQEILKAGSLEKTIFLEIISKVDNSSWILCKENQGCMLKSKLQAKDEVIGHCGSLSIAELSENNEAASIGPCQELKQKEEERTKYKSKITIQLINKDDQHLPEDALMSSYDILVENKSPSFIAYHCVGNELLPNYQAFASTVHQRKSRAKYMIQELLKDGSLEKTIFLGTVSKVDNSSWILCKENQGCMLNSMLQAKDEVIEHCVSLSIAEPSENDEAASIGPCQELKQKEEERTQYKTMIIIHHLNKVEVQEKSETDVGKTDENDTETGYESNL